MKPLNLEIWQQTADYVLAPLLAEELVDNNHDHYWFGLQHGLMAYIFPEGQHRMVYLTVVDLIEQKKPVHLATLQTALEGTVSSDYLAMLFHTYKRNSSLSGKVFQANIETLRDFGARNESIRKLQGAENALINGDKRGHDSVIADTISGLLNMGVDTIKNETAEGMAKDFEAYMSEMPEAGLMSGVELVDNWIGGFGRGDFVAIVASMKQRKTSLALNMLIHMARAGKSVALMMFESDKRMVNAMMVSMLAIEYLLLNGKYDVPIVNHNGVEVARSQYIWAKALYKLRARYPELGQLRADAVRYGMSEFAKLSRNLRVYERKKDGGSLTDTSSVQRIALRDKALYDTELIVIDHAQRIAEKGKNEYERLANTVPYLEALARREQIAICLLAQLKAGEAEGTGDTHLSGVRGGSILDEAVDYMLITGYRQKMDEPMGDMTRYPEDVLMVGLHHNRYGEGGTSKRKFVSIDPNSGYILFRGEPLREVNLIQNNIQFAIRGK